MPTKTVRELRADAQAVLAAVDLNGVFLMRSDFQAEHRTGEFDLVTMFSMNTKFQAFENHLLCWVRHQVVTIVKEEDLELPDDPAEIPAEIFETHLAWRGECEWVAQHVGQKVRSFEKSQLNAFTVVMAPPLVHPYAREHFQAEVGKSLYPAFTLPYATPIGSFPDDQVVELEDVE